MKHTITRLLCAVMILCTLLTLAACGTVGTYVLSKAEMDGQTYDTEAMKALGADPDDCYIELDSNGTGTVCLFGEKAELRWEGNEIWPKGNDADVAEFSVSGTELVLELDGDTLTFTRE